MQRVVIDPPQLPDGRFIYQEDGCYDLVGYWQVPAQALHVATALGAAYIPPLGDWEQFAAAMAAYDRIWLLYTPPLSKYLAAPADLRPCITAVRNPHGFPCDLREAGFGGEISASDFPLRVDQRFWFMFDKNPATVQINSGCPYGCRCCPTNRNHYPRQRWADPIEAAELTSRSVFPYLLCSQITGNRDWLAVFLGALRRPFNEFWTDLNCAHVESYEREIRQLAASGMRQAIVGVETLTAAGLRRLGCPHTVEQAKAMYRLLVECGVEGDWQIRYGFGESLEEIEHTRSTLVRLAEENRRPDVRQCVTTGPFYFWSPSQLSDSLDLEKVAPLGYEVPIEKLGADRRDAWLEAYADFRAAGLTVR